MEHEKIGFVGLGLIGGSIAKAVRRYYPEWEIAAFDKNRETLALAVQEGTIHTACSSIDDNFRDCSYIFLCTPVAYNTAYLSQLKDLAGKDCILTDVGSVKTSIHEEVTALGMDEIFIGGHPMAGSEKSGFINAKAHLIENAYYILTPSSKVKEEKVEAYKNFIASLKALPVVLDYREHDFITGTISHLPHIIAATLVNFVRDTDTKDELMKQLAAGGFKDITRIASSSPTMWQHICLNNHENISHILQRYIDMLTETPCPTLLPAPLKSSLHFTAILLTKPEESPLLPRFLPVTILISKISESYTTGNLKRECFALSSIRKLHVQKQPLCFRNTDI